MAIFGNTGAQVRQDLTWKGAKGTAAKANYVASPTEDATHPLHVLPLAEVC